MRVSPCCMLLSQCHVQHHHDTDPGGKEHRAKIGALPL